MVSITTTYLETVMTATPQPGRLNVYPSAAVPARVEFCGVMETMPG